jgi:DNA mismatch repair protein MutS2
VLDFPRVREMLAEMCSTPMGRERALALEPGRSRAQVAEELDRVETVLGLPDEPPLFEVKDLRPLLSHLRAQGSLTGPELLQVRQACIGIRHCRDFFARHREGAARVAAMVADLVVLPEIEREIDRAVDDAGGIKDSATPELERIRVKLRHLRNRLVERLERMAADQADWFGGAVTVRGDRFVLPLRVDHRNDVPGVVHGSSGSGQTLFVEPIEAVAEGNELAELRDAEVEEVARILRVLSRLVAEHEQELTRAMDAAAAMDSLNARRRFAQRFECTRPELSEDGRLDLIRARHPLLLRRRVQVVPLTFSFPDETTVVLVSGPNAGGKTVVLRTVGLLSLMVSSGMFLPADKGTRLPVFAKVYADIGDEQSLDSDLSSFTAHLARLTEILDGADRTSLVLVDEIGASTAPEEGAALAVAVLEALRDRGVKSLVTTHFGTLKLFAQDEPGMANAAMEWGQAPGQQRRGPTYRLVMGTPGESSAFEIAEQAGMPRAVVERARSRMGREWLDLSAKLRSLDKELDSAREARQAAERMQQQAVALRQEHERKMNELKLTRIAEQDGLRLERERLLVDKRREIENLVRQIRERKADHESVVQAKAAIEQELTKLPPAVAPEPVHDVAGTALKPGDTVESHTFRRQGTVVEVSDSLATVAFGQIRMALDLGDLRAVSPAAVVAPGEPVPDEPYRFDPKLNVRGMTREEANEALVRFLDEAAASGVGDLFILHGKGTGALRQMLWQRLRRDPRVAQVKLGEAAEGGSGVTLVTLKGPS